MKDNCLYLNEFLLVWPEDYVLEVVADQPQVKGGGWVISPGDYVVIGGGQYAGLGDLPGGSELAGIPCQGPYIWIGEFLSVDSPTSDRFSAPA